MTLGLGTLGCPLIGWAAAQPSLNQWSVGVLRERACLSQTDEEERQDTIDRLEWVFIHVRACH